MEAPAPSGPQGPPCIFRPTQGPPGAAPQPHPSWNAPQGQRVVLQAQRPAPQTPMGVSQPLAQVQAARAAMPTTAVAQEPQSQAPAFPPHWVAQPVPGDAGPESSYDADFDMVDDAQNLEEADPAATPVPPVCLFPDGHGGGQGDAPNMPIYTPEGRQPAQGDEQLRSRSGGRLAAPPAFAGPSMENTRSRGGVPQRTAAPPAPAVSNADLLDFMRGFRADVGSRLDKLEDGQNFQAAQIHELQDRALQQEKTTQELLHRMASVEARPPTTASSSAPSSASGSFGGRDPFAYDPTVLRANVPGVASAAAVWTAFRQAVREAKCRPEDFEMLGSSDEGRLAKRFTFQSKGPRDAAAQRAKTVVQSLRLPGGQFKQLSIKSPDGGDVPLYLSLDTAVAHLIRKRATKRVAEALKRVGAPAGLYVAARDGIVANAWVTWAEIKFVATTVDTEVQWHDAEIRRCGVDPAAAREEYAALCQGAGAPARG